jgi:hypothetical protein
VAHWDLRSWGGRAVLSGVYILRLEADSPGVSDASRVVVIK